MLTWHTNWHTKNSQTKNPPTKKTPKNNQKIQPSPEALKPPSGFRPPLVLSRLSFSGFD
ncbi:MAG: hypothetical protein MRECE_19c024 [Mycoplasmataceae bacterium CE_OT135]|nr:MAG: hypothetical protein MRECE_19c024 [Mycoplasmataceae bacterium CE_OT135]